MPPKFQKMLEEQRQNPETSRAGLPWDLTDDDTLMENVSNGVSLDQIAKLLKRSEGSIKTRLITTAINKMLKEEMSIEDASAYVNLPSSDIEEYQRKKSIRDAKKVRKVPNATRPAQSSNQPRQTNSVSLMDLHSLLMEIKEELAKLTG